MRNIGHLIVRLVTVGTGLVLAFVAAAFFLAIGLYSELAEPALGQAGAPADGGIFVLVIALFSSPFIAGAAFGPAAVLVAIAEWLRLRGMTANIVLGGLAALFAFFIRHDFAPGVGLSGGALVVLLATGFIGGFVYWLVAGRSAGRWLERHPVASRP